MQLHLRNYLDHPSRPQDIYTQQKYQKYKCGVSQLQKNRL